MKVMFIVYHDIRTSARTQEILECAKRMGKETIFVSYSVPFEADRVRTILTGGGQRRYFNFTWKAIRAIKQENPDVVILHDNYTATILRWLVKNRKDIFVIYDSSELYIDGRPSSFKELIARHMRYFERKYLKHADVVIAANSERAEIMKEYFQLPENPIVFDNMHRIDDPFDAASLDKQYGHLFSQDKFNILYAGGVATARLTFKLVEHVGRLGNGYRLIICGGATDESKRKLEQIIEANGFSNIHYIGFVSRSELRYFLNRAHISVSAFSQDRINNIYCASGKLYESLFEGTPVLTSENPPLKRLCKETGVGVSDNDFQRGILELQRHYDRYCRNVEAYIKTIDYDRRIEVLAEQLKGCILRSEKTTVTEK